MKAFLIIGHTGRGKTTIVKKIISQFPDFKKMIYDVNNEYSEFGTKAPPPIYEFTAAAAKAINSVIVFEEATIFFKHRTKGHDVQNILVRKRHTSNIVIFVFHSLRSVPLEILDLIDYVYLLPTNDNINIIESKFSGNESIIEAFRKVHEQSKGAKKGEFNYHAYKFFAPL